MNTVDIFTTSLRKINKIDRKLNEAVRIKNYSFASYIQKRLVKDGLGFIPCNALLDGSTDCYSYIQSKVPTEPYELLVYTHELGHIKSKQFRTQELSYLYSGRACEIQLRNEYNAWMWALRYYRRLGFTLCDKGKELIKSAFGSYLKAASIADQALYNELIRKTIGIDLLNKSAPSKKVTVKPKGWNPWHELKKAQTKKQWRNQR